MTDSDKIQTFMDMVFCLHLYLKTHCVVTVNTLIYCFTIIMTLHI